MLREWAVLVHVGVICCSLLLLHQVVKLKLRLRMQLVIAAVGLNSLVHVAGFGESFKVTQWSSLVTSVLCLLMVFLMQEVLAEWRTASLQLRLGEGIRRYPWEWFSGYKGHVQPILGPLPDRRKDYRYPIRAVAKICQKDGRRAATSGVIEDIGPKGLRLRISEPIPLPAVIKVEALGQTFLGIVRRCETAPDNKEFYVGIEFERRLDVAALEKVRALAAAKEIDFKREK